MRPINEVISAMELYPLREAAKRLRWGRKTMTKAQREGLCCVTYGREKYVRGQAIIEFIQRLEQHPGDSSIFVNNLSFDDARNITPDEIRERLKQLDKAGKLLRAMLRVAIRSEKDALKKPQTKL
jgi:hypothetical protein